jgi:UDP-N-acetylmuramoyl-tripeptide--D-alanyl-D-alanine ligase
MAATFTEAEVLEATGGRRLSAGPPVRFGGVCTDTRKLTPGALFVALKGARYDGHDFLPEAVAAGAAGLVVEQARHATAPPSAVVFEVADTLAALGALARCHRRRFRVPVGAVTGSNGKTTTKELIAAILETRGAAHKTVGNLNNEIGVPLTLLALERAHRSAIIELGMNRPGEISRLTAMAEPDAGLITCVQPVHLEGLGSLENVGRAKGELYEGLASSATAVVNLDDEQVVAQASRTRAKRLTFGRAAGADVCLARADASGRDGLALSIRHAGRDWPVRLGLLGAHNAMNAAGAFAMGLALGFPPEACAEGLAKARPQPRRLSLAAGLSGVTVLDDCYNANPASMTAGLQTLAALAGQGRPVAVLGDMLELGGIETEAHAAMGATAARYAELVAFFGPRMKRAWANAKDALGSRTAHFEDVDALLTWLRGWLRAGDTVLVKGSRGMRLERVVDGLTGRASGGGH